MGKGSRLALLAVACVLVAGCAPAVASAEYWDSPKGTTRVGCGRLIW